LHAGMRTTCRRSERQRRSRMAHVG
jgi:hypothetical protein